MMDLGHAFKTRNILADLVGKWERGGIMEFLFAKINPHLIDPVNSIRFGMIAVKTQFMPYK